MRQPREDTVAVLLSRRLQIALITVVLLTWLVSSLFPLVMAIRHTADSNTNYLWFMTLSQVILPLVYLGIGFSYAIRRYRSRLHQSFVGVFLAVLGCMLYNVVFTLYNMYLVGFNRLREYLVEPSFMTQYGVEISIMVLCLALFTALVWHHDWRHGKNR